MLDIRKNKNVLYATATGNLFPIKKIKDEVFSKQMIGPEIAIFPEADEIVSPCDGKVSMIFPTLHSFGITMENGIELLIHIGIDTVNLRGKGFTQLAKTGDRVKKGTPIIKIDRTFIQQKGFDPSVITVITNQQNYEFTMRSNGSVQAGKDVIADFKEVNNE